MDEQIQLLVQKIKECESCDLRDFPLVRLEHLESHIAKHGPIVDNKGRVYDRFELLSPGQLLPRMTVHRNALVSARISRHLGNFLVLSNIGGRITCAEGANILDDFSFLMPSICWFERQYARQLSNAQSLTYSESFSASFIIEIDQLVGEHSSRSTLFLKARRYFTQSNCRLMWLIDPFHQIMIVLCRSIENENGFIVDVDESWRDLNGNDLLPGYTLPHRIIDEIMSDFPNEENLPAEQFQCPELGCILTFQSRRAFVLHYATHCPEMI